MLNQWGLVTAWASDTANVHDTAFRPLLGRYVHWSLSRDAPDGGRAPDWEADMIILADGNFHGAEGDPPNLKLCGRGQWNQRMLMETVLSMLDGVCKLKRLAHCVWRHLNARLAFAMAAYNICVAWDGLRPDETGFIKLSLAQFSL